MRKHYWAATALLLFLTFPVLSHDYWFKPEFFFAPIGRSVAVHLYVGDEYKIEEERPLQKDRTVNFQMFSASQPRLDLVSRGQDNQIPVARLNFSSPGNHLIAMERTGQQIKLEAARFNQYLNEEGLQSIIRLREKAGESGREGRERYRRYLKALFQVGQRHDNTYKRVIGQKLEILPESNPYSVRLGGTLGVRILFEGKPLANAKVFAYNDNDGDIHQQSKFTGVDGTAVFRLDRPGEWLIRLVHMRRCVADCAEIDWESFWGAYSFGFKPTG